MQQCSSLIRIVRVNRKTLALFEADSTEQLVANLLSAFRGDMLETHVEELVQLWDGQPGFTSNAVNYTLGGKRGGRARCSSIRRSRCGSRTSARSAC